MWDYEVSTQVFKPIKRMNELWFIWMLKINTNIYWYTNTLHYTTFSSRIMTKNMPSSMTSFPFLYLALYTTIINRHKTHAKTKNLLINFIPRSFFQRFSNIGIFGITRKSMRLRYSELDECWQLLNKPASYPFHNQTIC